MDKSLDRGKLKKIVELYCFGEFRLDAEERRLWRGGELIPLTPKEFEVLLFLVENAGRVAEKNDLLDAIWAETYVEETTLARNVSWLRKKLDPDTNGKKLIETVPKRGYRFTGEVTRSRNDANLLIVEEQTVQHFRLEETITLEPDDNPLNALSDPTALVPFDARNQIKHLRLIWLAFGLLSLAGISFVIFQIYFQTNAPANLVASRVVPFSGATGRENTPSFSPDGKQLAYSWNGDEAVANDIYVRIIGTGEPLRLTNTEANEHYPTYSPDGSHIAFVRELKTHGEVILIPSLGGTERLVCRLFSGNYSISYSPDGQNIAVIDKETSTESGQFAVYLFDLQTGERRRLTAPANFLGETTPRFSPDGKKLAFVRVSLDQKQDLFVVPVEGGEAQQLTLDGVVIHSLAWSADGQGIYFVSFRESNQPAIWRIPATGGSPEIFSTGGKNITNIAASSNGKTFAFVENLNHATIWRLTASEQSAQKLIASTGIERDPQFSPDGSRIVFLSDRTGKIEIWTADANGRQLRQITDTQLEVSSPQFSPDNSRIVYQMVDEDNSAIFVIPAEGGVAKKLTPEKAKNGEPTWSADGEWIYFLSNRTGEDQLWKIKADGSGDVIQITQNGVVLATPAPARKTIFYIKSFGANELWQIPAEGGEEKLIPEITAAGFAGRWSATQTGIYFLVPNTDQSFNIKFYDFALGEIKGIAGNYKIPYNVFASGSASPDGNVFIYSAEEPNTSRLMLAELPQKAN